ncbi:mast/stem cell growth factor receptor Kit-like [Lingula anatina]|uniref:receptor protein-tyrosine kinase n=1 Tax=Lingula anatina TaxID=7574 RepID=A0A1S3HYM0_LINAN|nr:mast/stem cell growth factor receptor Kit-like [Lingula anatina]|eukprot:XP_013390179.1 mast/stem cell growth factor receptor Kit-like [Lingula anatina]
MGDTAYLICITASGSTPITYTWLLNNTLLQQTHRELTINNIQPNQAGPYSCNVNNSISWQQSGTFTFNVQTPIEGVSITRSRATGHDVTKGDTGYLKCTTTLGFAPRTYTWFLDNAPLQQTGSELTISNIQPSQAGPYTCNVSNSISGQSRTFFFNVLYAPDNWQNIPTLTGYNATSDKLVTGETSVTLACRAPGGNPLASLSWTSGCPSGSTSAHFTSNTSEIRLQFTVQTSHHQTTCGCNATHAHGAPESKQRQVTFLVIHPPSSVNITLSPPLPWLATGQNPTTNAQLTCSATGGYPTPTLSWQRNSVSVPGSATYTFQAVDISENQVEYKCLASNDYTTIKGVTVQKALRLDVQYHPIVQVSVSPSSTREVNESVTLICTAYGNPTVTSYRWQKGSWTTGQANHTIQQLTKDDSGQYTCTVTANSARHSDLISTKNITLIVQYLTVTFPVVPEQTEGDNLSMTCTAQGEPGGNNIRYQKWMFQPTGGGSVTELDNTSDRLVITRIQYTDAGVYTCIATNGVFTKAASGDVIVRYSPKRDPNTRYQGRVSGDIGETKALSVHVIAYPKPTSFTWKKGEQVVNITSQDQDFSSSLPILIDEASYGNYTCEVTNGVKEPLVVHFTLERSGKPDIPLDFRAVSSSAVSVTVSWRAGNNGGRRQVFTLQYKEATSAQWLSISNIPDPGFGQIKQYKITGLRSGVTYNVRVRAENEIDDASRSASPFTDILDINTKALTDQTNGTGIIVWIVVPIALVIIAIVIAILVCKIRSVRRKKDGPNTQIANAVRMDDMKVSEESPYIDMLQRDVEIPRSSIKMLQQINKGAFVLVFKGSVFNMYGKKKWTTVAIKTTRDEKDAVVIRDLMNELKVMMELSVHPNVVSLLGSCTRDGGVPMVITEYLSNGDLQTFLRNDRSQNKTVYNNLHGNSMSLTSRDLMKFALDVARGMSYLSSSAILHRDLAARNVLVSEDKTCKITNFGFAKDVIESHQYERNSEGRLPVRWMSPEALHDNIFTTQSDVWAYGVLLWEIVTLGSSPYPGMSARQVIEAVTEGYRMPQPPHCSQDMYSIMLSCWEVNPRSRPTFQSLADTLNHLLSANYEVLFLGKFEERLYEELDHCKPDEKC